MYRRFLYERVKETVGRQYAVLHPLQSEYKHARQVRCSPLYSTLSAQGAVFGTRMCFERPLYFDPNYQGQTFKGRNIESNSKQKNLTCSWQ